MPLDGERTRLKRRLLNTPSKKQETPSRVFSANASLLTWWSFGGQTPDRMIFAVFELQDKILYCVS